MNCGEAIFIKDSWGTNVWRYIAQCDGRFLIISHKWDQLNGYLLPDWHGVLRELVALTVPAKLTDKVLTAESTATGLWTHIPLTWPLSAKGLADLLGVTADEVRGQLADLAVDVDG